MKFCCYFLPLQFSIAFAWWHLYDEGKRIFDKRCFEGDKLKLSVEEGTRPLSLKEIEQWKLWPGITNADDMTQGEVVFGFRDIMSAIWSNQHPVDCKNAKFLIADGWDQGFGSEIHVLSVGLALAMKMNRVYVQNPDGPKISNERSNHWQIENHFCKNQGKQNLECYFEPWTHCSNDDIFGKGIPPNLTELRNNKETFISEIEFVADNRWNTTERVVLLNTRGDVRDPIPDIVDLTVRCSPISQPQAYYLWRAVSTAFFLRPNEKTLKLFQYHALPFDSRSEKCVSAYVRHGDKHVEMTLKPFEMYAEASKLLWESGLVKVDSATAHANIHASLAASDPNKKTVTANEKGVPVMFLGSEDPIVIEKGTKWGIENNWKVLYSNVFDRTAVSASLNFTVQQDLRMHRTDRHHPLEYFSMLLNLHYHMKCSAFVCTQSSNFCRVIDELRATSANKANRHYVDLSCHRHQPCIDEGFDLNW